MSGVSSTTSFFSFGPDDSFISKSFVGLNFNNLPPSLRDILTSSTISSVHWATLGDVPDSWILSCKDTAGKTSLRWGPSLPPRLQTILNKTWHSPHLRISLGPDSSFIVWHPELIRWTNLPTKLEDAIQSWLTPSGWRVGPPRIVTWGADGAFFAMSEYGNVVYDFGDTDDGGDVYWGIFKETVEEWKEERGFQWNSLSFIALDPSSADQFIAVRKDGTWAGSIDDVNEDALETFALNFWGPAKTKYKTTPAGQNAAPGPDSNNDHNSNATESNPNDTKTQALYSKWSTETATLFASASTFLSTTGPNNNNATKQKQKQPRKLQVRSPSTSSDTTATTPLAAPVTNTVPAPPLRPRALSRTPSTTPKLLSTFPYLPSIHPTCNLPTCILLKASDNSIHTCQHDVEKLLRASGLYSYEWLRQERLRWHPDRFGRLCEEGWREEGKRMAGEMFKVLSALIEEVRVEEKGKEGGVRGA
ncbi:hypothetical protein T440DRAFT_458191 [Plenodomus tracheiphilus IPT5]|uniref:Uncharacterized protein n=1 Tax=Plenodomus tracheiphilus IPT5 TaxID=1408161 RepID=A0A6A7ATW8_9PLEO|nr:hypothetical protein T440DRAFT_458191 [Plenodomus tracheiphilus IPT5]